MNNSASQLFENSLRIIANSYSRSSYPNDLNPADETPNELVFLWTDDFVSPREVQMHSYFCYDCGNYKIAETPLCYRSFCVCMQPTATISIPATIPAPAPTIVEQ